MASQPNSFSDIAVQQGGYIQQQLASIEDAIQQFSHRLQQVGSIQQQLASIENAIQRLEDAVEILQRGQCVPPEPNGLNN
jgi:flagellin-like hook-associated protein FlgL